MTVGQGDEQVEEWLELKNGCLCCSVKDSGVKAIENLMLKRGKFDYILLETTGKWVGMVLPSWGEILFVFHIIIFSLSFPASPYHTITMITTTLSLPPLLDTRSGRPR